MHELSMWSLTLLQICFLIFKTSYRNKQCSTMLKTQMVIILPNNKGSAIVTRESYSLEANNALLFYLFVHLFLVPSLLEGASNFCEDAKHMAEGTHTAGYDHRWRRTLMVQ